MVIFNFIRDKEVGMFARLKRNGKETSKLSTGSTAHTVACTADVSNGSDSDGSDSDSKKTD
jgi:hypothetical protein